MELSIILIDDDNTFAGYVGTQMGDGIKQLGKNAEFKHINPEDRYDTKHGVDVMCPRFLDIIRETKAKANSVIILSDATFISNLSDELLGSTLPERLELFGDNNGNLKLGVLTGTPIRNIVQMLGERYIDEELGSGYTERLKFVKKETGLYIPWIEKPVIVSEILEGLPWNQRTKH